VECVIITFKKYGGETIKSCQTSDRGTVNTTPNNNQIHPPAAPKIGDQF
jgi:hypothetical protein